jgi:hypothetical protein
LSRRTARKWAVFVAVLDTEEHLPVMEGVRDLDLGIRRAESH